MKAQWTDAEIVAACKAYKQCGSYRKTASFLGIGATKVDNLIKVAKDRGLSVDTVLRDPLEKAKEENEALKLELRQAQRAAESADAIRQEIWKLASYKPDPPRWLTVHKKASGTPGAPMTNWSDWHYGERVRREQSGGMNEYNSEIAADRIRLLASETIKLVKGFAFSLRKKAVEFPGIVVGLGGDMISGDIHEELLATNDRTPGQCVNELTDLISAALIQLLGEFPKIYVPCVVGNHGRTTRKPRMKDRVYTSWEWNLYQSLERYFRNDPRIKFDIPEDTDCYFDCMGTKFLWTHGDTLAAKGGDGIIGAIGPVTRGMMKVMAAYEAIGKPVDHIVIGHWHQELWLPRGNVNNSLKGDDEFARLALRATHSRPSQNLWFVHPDHGITARMPVYVDGGKQVVAPGEFVSIFRKGK